MVRFLLLLLLGLLPLGLLLLSLLLLLLQGRSAQTHRCMLPMWTLPKGQYQAQGELQGRSGRLG
jgi:hypothetical protein